MQWQVITSEIDPRQSTMSTVFGNNVAVEYARTHDDHNYPTGSVLSVVTWNQQEDARWFGAKIPDAPRSVEFVRVSKGSSGQLLYSYQAFAGTPLTAAHNEENSKVQGRTALILEERAALFP